MRDLHTVITDEGVAIVDRCPGPYVHSKPTDVVVFTMTAEEAKQLEKNRKSDKGESK